MSANASPLNPTPATASQQISCVVDGVTVVPSGIHGWSLADSTGTTAAKVRLRDGTSASAPLRAVIEVPAGGSSEELTDQSIDLVNGAIFLEFVSGSVEGTVYWA